MADLSSVESALVGIIASALFPNLNPYLQGDYQPCAIGQTVKLYRGWPESANLNADMALGRAHVSVFSDPGMTRNVTRWMAPQATVVTANTATITATVSGATVTLGGTITAGNVVGIQCGASLASYAYAVQAGDTLATVAAALASKIAGASYVGSVITLPTALYVSAATMVPQTAYTVTRQQEQGIRVSVWASKPSDRDAISGLLDASLANLKNAAGGLTHFFPVGAYEAARLVYRTTYVNDIPSRDRIWRRDLCYTVEYATTLIEQDPSMLFGIGTITPSGSSTVRQFDGNIPAYVGPGDIVSGATAFWGLRAYSAAAANAQMPAVNVRRASDNTAIDVNVLPSGSLDVSTLAAFLASTTGFVAKWYDQTGNGQHMAQATAANQPQIVLSGPNALPTVIFNSVNATNLAWAAPTIQQPYSYVSVGMRTGNIGSNSAMIGNNGYHAVLFYSSANHAVMQGGATTGAQIVAADNAMHAFIGVANAAASTLSVDGAISGAGLTITDTASISGTAWLGQVQPGNWLLTGDMMESGIWPSALTTTQQTNLTANQRAYFGF